MKIAGTVALTMALMLVPKAGRPAEIRLEERFIAQFWHLLKLSAWGQSSFEHAAFIVRDDSGKEDFVPWPYLNQFEKASFYGAIPANTVAIVHTHPNPCPFPSDNDKALAARLRLPIYVLTRTMITRTTGTRIEILRLGAWKPSPKRAGTGE